MPNWIKAWNILFTRHEFGQEHFTFYKEKECIETLEFFGQLMSPTCDNCWFLKKDYDSFVYLEPL